MNIPNVLSEIRSAGFDPTSLYYGELRQVFLPSIKWLHKKCHELEGPQGTITKPGDDNPDVEHFGICLQLLGNDYLRGVIEGRFSRCGDDDSEHHVKFKISGVTIHVECKSFKK